MKTLNFTILIIVTIMLSNCNIIKSKDYKTAQKKTNFDIESINNEGIIVTKGTFLSYEFCIPNNEPSNTEVKKIDSKISIYISAKGRIGCSKKEVLCIGNTENKNYRETLIKLSKLNYVKNINESLFE